MQSIHVTMLDGRNCLTIVMMVGGVGGGFSVGYSKMLSKRWNFEAELGGSLMWHDFDKYLCKECGSLPDPGHKINFVPTKLSLAFVYLF